MLIELDIEIPDLVDVEIETSSAAVTSSGTGETVLLATAPLTALDIEIPDLVGIDIETPSSEVDPASGGETVLLVAVPGPPGPQGSPGDGTTVVGETLTGPKNGANTVFTTAFAFLAGTTAVYLNGLREFFYTETGASEITLEDAPESTDTLRVDYVI